jgi:glucosamine-6-phosphate deaminase
MTAPSTTAPAGTTALKYQLKSFEKIPIKMWDNPDDGAIHIARYIALCIRQKQQENDHLVLGLATLP